jgi:hypothetical protein
MANFIETLISKRNGNENETMLPEAVQTSLHQPGEIERGNMNELGYTRAGRNNGDPSALSNSFELIKSGQIVDENNNEQKQNERIASLDKKIEDLKGEINCQRVKIDKIDQIELPGIEREIETSKQKIGEIRNTARNLKYNRNKFNLILTWVGFVAGFLYLYLFYVSAIHSALFRNIAGEVANADKDSVGQLLTNIFNVTAFKEFNLHWIAPIIFFIFAVILHFALEIKSKVVKWPAVGGVIFFVLIADGLLAYCIENNNHILSKLMGLTDGSWVFYKSFIFYLVLFFGFFTSMGWSLILHKLANEFESANPEKKAEEEIHLIEKTLKQLYVEKGIAGSAKIENTNAINSLDEKIKSLERSKSNAHYSLVDLEKNIDDFYNGWLSYLNGLKSDIHRKQECESIYIRFKSDNFNKALTA